MTWLKKLFRADSGHEKVDYYREGLELLAAGKYHEALTSFRLAQRESPEDTAIMQQIAITYTRIGMTDEAARTYRGVLDRDPEAPGAHYGLAFLLLADGKKTEAAAHLRSFLAHPPQGPEADRHVGHAKQTLTELEAPPDTGGTDGGERGTPGGEGSPGPARPERS